MQLSSPVLSKKFNVAELVNDVMDIEYPAARAKSLELIFEGEDDIPDVVLGDRARLYRILLNLMGNAVTFTPSGFVKITTQVAKKIDDKRLLLRFIVQDTGVGIPVEKQHTIYERFVRCTPSNQGVYPGTGLGLCIVKQFVEDLGGEIEVKSELGRGTTFVCLLPFELPLIDGCPSSDNNNTVVESKKNQAVLKILLVEDDFLARKVGASLLENDLSSHVDVAETGEEAMRAIETGAYDLVFMDLGLPDISGYDVTKKVRRLESYADLPIIALTAHNAAVAEGPAMEAGLSDFVTKPLTVDKAKFIFKKWLGGNGSS